MTETTRATNGRSEKRTGRGRSSALRLAPVFSTPGVHPYDEVTWERRDVVQTNWKTGEVVFEQKAVEFPSTWSVNASTIVTTKYFRGALGSDVRETSLRQLIDRVVKTYRRAGEDYGYFVDGDTAEVFEHELTWMLLHQYFSFNSPVWFNVGTKSPQQVSACFILSVDDSMDSILNWYKEEGFIFKGGSGAGLNLSRIRSSKELLSSGGTASGPVSFMRGADASAGTIKSGGATRRAAKMVVLDVDHPDIEEFVETKAREENKIRALRDAGFDMDLGGRDITSVQYQNANNSVRVSDTFMRAVEDDASFDLRARSDNRVVETVQARELFDKIAQAAWACADPGIQYDDTINDWHTNPETGRITASNPCSEYMSLDNSSCNLASLNLLKFLRDDDSFDAERFEQAVELIITAMDISICFADFPTESIGQTTRDYRQLGIGYANLGALLMATGHGYDSDGGRAFAAAITSLMTGVSYRRSAELAAIVGPYAGYARNADAHKRVMRKHQAANDSLRVFGSLDADVHKRATAAWDGVVKLGETQRLPQRAGQRARADRHHRLHDGLRHHRHRARLLPGEVQEAGRRRFDADRQPDDPAGPQKLGYTSETAEAIVEFIAENGHVIDAPGLRPEHYEVFDTAMGKRAIKPMGHVRMMAAAQPFLSGAISKTVNLPETATVDEIADVYLQGWKLGLKALAVYRDNCKVGQPLSDGKAEKKADAVEAEPTVIEKVVYQPTRKRLPKSRPSRTTSFSVGGAEGYMTSGSYPDDGLGEVFLKLGKQGSTLAGVMDAFSIATSIGLQYGVPLETYVQKFTNLKFEPAGLTDDPDIRMAQSIMDYIFRRLALDYLTFEERAELGIYTASERARQVETGSYLAEEVEEIESESLKNDAGDQVDTDSGSTARRSVRDGDPGPGRCSDHLGAVRGDHRDQRRRTAVLDLRHQDAAERQLLRLRGLRLDQRLQLSQLNDERPRGSGPGAVRRLPGPGAGLRSRGAIDRRVRAQPGAVGPGPGRDLRADRRPGSEHADGHRAADRGVHHPRGQVGQAAEDPADAGRARRGVLVGRLQGRRTAAPAVVPQPAGRPDRADGPGRAGAVRRGRPRAVRRRARGVVGPGRGRVSAVRGVPGEDRPAHPAAAGRARQRLAPGPQRSERRDRPSRFHREHVRAQHLRPPEQLTHLPGRLLVRSGGGAHHAVVQEGQGGQVVAVGLHQLLGRSATPQPGRAPRRTPGGETARQRDVAGGDPAPQSCVRQRPLDDHALLLTGPGGEHDQHRQRRQHHHHVRDQEPLAVGDHRAAVPGGVQQHRDQVAQQRSQDAGLSRPGRHRHPDADPDRCREQRMGERAEDAPHDRQGGQLGRTPVGEG